MLRALAVRYVERYQTSCARLERYLARKIRERGWADEETPADIDELVADMARLGYVDDEAFAQSRARSMARRGLGARRVSATLQEHGISADIRAAILDDHDALQAAMDFARRKRFGPFGPPTDDPRIRQRQLASFARAGHPMEIALRILRASDADELSDD